MDAEIGRLLEALRNLNLDRRTLVVYTADHGEEFLEHGRMGHGQSMYGELAGVPLVMWGPGTVPAAWTGGAGAPARPRIHPVKPGAGAQVGIILADGRWNGSCTSYEQVTKLGRSRDRHERLEEV
jgi:hypothetical protein